MEGSGTWSLEHGALVCTSLCPHEQAGKAARECEVWLWTEAHTVGGALESHYKEEGEKESMCPFSASVGARP